MNVVWIAPYLPEPVTTGGRRRVLSLIQRLHGKHHISLVTYRRGESDDDLQRVRKMVESLHTVRRRPTKHPLNLMLWAFGPWPYMAAANGFNRSMVNTISTVVSRIRPDIIHCEHFHMWQVVSSALTRNRPPILLAEQGVEFLVTERFMRAAPTPLQRLGFWLELKKAKKWEKQACMAADGVVVVSEDDQTALLKHVPGLRTWVVQNGVDPDVFTPPLNHDERDKSTILFLGTFSFFGNRDALRYICSDIFPAVRRQIPGAVLKVIGERPPQLAADGIELLGAVPDVVPYLQSARVLLAPLRTGSGTKLKILEAMSCGLPFVTTDFGTEGLSDGASAGLVAHATEDIIEATVQLLTDDELAGDLGRRGRRIVESRYSWERSGQALERVWEEMSRG